MSKKILIVEDDQILQGLYKERLEIEGLTVIATANGKEGLELVKKERPDMALLDINLPGMSGVDILKSMKEDPELKDIPAIMLTAITDKEMENKCNDLGANGFLVKPFNTPKQVLETIQKFIG